MRGTEFRNSGVGASMDGTAAPLSLVTTFRLGGPCRRLETCADPDSLFPALRRCSEAKEPVFILGGGSNLLISDSGLDAVVIRYARDTLTPIRVGDGWVDVDGSAPLADLASWSVDEGWAGLEFAAGIPGTIGGGIVGNAGAFGRQLADRLKSLRVADLQGRVREAKPEEFAFGYRSSSLGAGGNIVVSARLRVCRGDSAALKAEYARILEFRKARHPDWRVTPTAGSFFRNIEATSAAERRQAAGWYLDQVGARSFRVGGAGVFEKHANIVIKKDETCATRDVLELTHRMAAAVQEKFGLRLIPEVRHVGRDG